MITMLPKKEEPMPAVEITKKIISLVATCLGLAIILIGLKYAMDIFQLIFNILKSPVLLTVPIQEMAQSIGGNAFDLKLEGRAVPLANIMALTVYCGAALLSAWLTMALMHTGAKIVSLTAGDKSAVKQLLQSAFAGSPQKTAAEDSPNKIRG